MKQESASTTKQPPEMAFSLFAVLPPGLDGRQSGIIQTGMTLRDYFAAFAMWRFANEMDGPGLYTFEDCARHAYRLADAMLEARQHGA